jgi:hypothetical protein
MFCIFVCCSQASKDRKSLDLCSLAANPLDHNKQVVRVTAFLLSGPEQEALYDPKCRGGDPLVAVELKSSAKGNVEGLRQIIAKRHYAFVTVEGELHGPEPVEVDPQLPENIRERFKGSVKHYGHSEAFEMMIQIENILDAQDVDDGLLKTGAAPNR